MWGVKSNGLVSLREPAGDSLPVTGLAVGSSYPAASVTTKKALLRGLLELSLKSLAYLTGVKPHLFKIAWPSAEWGSLPIEGGVAAAYRRAAEIADEDVAINRAIAYHPWKSTIDGCDSCAAFCQ